MTLADEAAAITEADRCSIARALDALNDEDSEILRRWLRTDKPTAEVVARILRGHGIPIDHKSVRRHRDNGGTCHKCRHR